MDFVLIISVVINVLILILVVWLCYFIYKPTKIGVKLQEFVGLNKQPIDESPVIFTDRNGITGNIYTLNPTTPNNDRIIIDVPGGAFIDSTPAFAPYKWLKLPFTVIALQYPTLFDSRANTALVWIEDAIKSICQQFPRAKITIVGSSAGSYYSALTLKKFEQIDSFISVSGYFGAKSTDSLLFKVADKLYLTSFTGKEFDVGPAPSHVSLFLAAGANDKIFLNSSQYYADLNLTKIKIYIGSHLLFSDYTYGEEVRKDVKDFILTL